MIQAESTPYNPEKPHHGAPEVIFVQWGAKCNSMYFYYENDPSGANQFLMGQIYG